MKTNLLGVGFATLLLGAAWCADAADTNTPPWSDSFESYTNGTLLNATNGWTGSQPDAGTITSAQDVVNLLTNYPGPGKSYPITGTHTNVVSLNAEVVNHLQSATGGVVKLDLMALPTLTEQMPAGDTNRQYQICIATNGLLTVWHHNRTAGTNEWRELAASPVISTGVWTRFTVLHDYSNHMFQIVVNEGTPVTDATGWTAGGASSPGSWFYMVQTNGFMSAFLAEAAPSYLDDVAIARRSLSWSRTNFTESVINNGTIDNSSPLTITLAADTFAGELGDDFVASGKVTVGGLPASLAAVVEKTGATQVSVTLTNRATLHEAVNSSNLTIQFASTAFTMMAAWDVTGSQTNAGVTFLDTPILSYSSTLFSENTTNNGSIDNSTPVLITLANGTFAGALNEDFALNASKLVIGNLPTGLSAEARLLSTTEIQLKLLGLATQHDVGDNLSNLTVTFQDDAFNTVPATSVFFVSTNFSVSFIDPSDLSYLTDVFTETVANTGAVNGTTLTLVNKSFNAGEGEDLVDGGKVTVANLPNGLGLQVVRGVTAQEATLIFTGAANSHAAANNISNLGITFLDSAFVSANAAGVADYTRANLQIQFISPRSLAYSETSFTEISGGAIDNRTPVTITLTGDTLTGGNGDNFVAAGKITVANVPAGLTAVITRSSDTQLSVLFTGLATAHTSDNTVSDVSFTFQNGAFAAGNAIYVGGYTNTGISLTFLDDTGFFNVMPYRESFESYPTGMMLTGSNGWTGWADAGIVTNIPALTSELETYVTPWHTLPIPAATHTQELYMHRSLLVQVHSEEAPRVFVDFLTVPVAMPEAPPNDANNQWEFYVATNGNLVVWQQTRNGGPSVNEWITLSNAPAISTSQWARFTIENDYATDMFRIWVNQGLPISDSRGWTGPGGSLGGTWFYMVQTNRTMTSFKVFGGGSGFLDDLMIHSTLDDSFYRTGGSLYLIR